MFIKKNVIILHLADKSACAFYRCDAMAALLRADLKEAPKASFTDKVIYQVEPSFHRTAPR